MSLRVWLPLTKDLRNQGLDEVEIINYGATFNSEGKLGGCYYFDGTDDRIVIKGLTLPNIWSYSCWIYSATSSRGWEAVIMLNSIGGDADLQLGFYTYPAGNRIQNTANGQYNSGISWTYGMWHHFCGTFDGSSLKTYIDGILVNTKNITASLLTRNHLTVGARCNNSTNTSASNFFQGKLNDVRIYDHALSPLEVKEISKGLVLHYPLNRGGFGQENFILESHKVTSGGQGSGITRTYEFDGSVKFVSTSGNGNYASLGFAQSSNTSVGNNMAVGDTYCISCDIKIESGTKLPTLFINSGNGYKQLKPVNGSIVIGKWMRVYYTSTWANPGTNYGNISLHLGFGDAIGTYYFKNFKLEKGSIPTPWCPNSSDALATTMGLNDNVEYDTSGFHNNGTRTGTFNWTSDTPKYNVSTIFTEGCSINVINNLSNPCSEFSVGGWVDLMEGYIKNNGCHLISFNGTYCRICISKDGQAVRVLLTNGSTNYMGGSTLKDNALIANEWNYFVITFKNGIIKIYINGLLDADLITTITQVNFPSSNIKIGQHGSEKPNAKVSDFRIYATALSADDVKSLYNNSAYIDNQGNIYGAVYEEV